MWCDSPFLMHGIQKGTDRLLCVRNFPIVWWEELVLFQGELGFLKSRKNLLHFGHGRELENNKGPLFAVAEESQRRVNGGAAERTTLTVVAHSCLRESRYAECSVSIDSQDGLTEVRTSGRTESPRAILTREERWRMQNSSKKSSSTWSPQA